MTLSDCERWDARDLLNNAHTIWPRTTKFGRITRGRGAYFSGSTMPLPQEVGPSAPQFWGFHSLLFMHTAFDAEYQIWLGNTHGKWLGFRVSTTPPSHGRGATAIPNSGGWICAICNGVADPQTRPSQYVLPRQIWLL